jgi:hypothetical protein
MVTSEATSETLRPTRCPNRPKSEEPNGRAIKAMANIASDYREAPAGSPAGKKICGKTMTAAGAQTSKVEELDDGPEERGEDDSIARVNPSSLVRLVEYSWLWLA